MASTPAPIIFRSSSASCTQPLAAAVFCVRSSCRARQVVAEPIRACSPIASPGSRPRVLIFASFSTAFFSAMIFPLSRFLVGLFSAPLAAFSERVLRGLGTLGSTAGPISPKVPRPRCRASQWRDISARAARVQNDQRMTESEPTPGCGCAAWDYYFSRCQSARPDGRWAPRSASPLSPELPPRRLQWRNWCTRPRVPGHLAESRVASARVHRVESPTYRAHAPADDSDTPEGRGVPSVRA